MERCRLIEANGLEVRKCWEYEVEAMLKDNPEMRKFLTSIEDNSKFLRVKESFHCGRFNPLSLKCDLTEIPEHRIFIQFDTLMLSHFNHIRILVVR